MVNGEAREDNGLNAFFTKVVENLSSAVDIVDIPRRLASSKSFLDCWIWITLREIYINAYIDQINI